MLHSRRWALGVWYLRLEKIAFGLCAYVRKDVPLPRQNSSRRWTLYTCESSFVTPSIAFEIGVLISGLGGMFNTNGGKEIRGYSSSGHVSGVELTLFRCELGESHT